MQGFKKQKDDSSKNIHWGILGCIFVGCQGLCRTSPATLAYAPTDVFDMFNAWKTWKMADLDIFALGKIFQEIVCKKGGRALTDPFKEDFVIIQKQLLRPNQDLQQAGLQLSGQPWMWNPTSFQRNIKKPHKSQVHHTTQITQITSIPPIKPLPSSIDGMIQRTIAAV